MQCRDRPASKSAQPVAAQPALCPPPIENIVRESGKQQLSACFESAKQAVMTSSDSTMPSVMTDNVFSLMQAQKALKYGRPQMTVRGQDVDYRSFHQDAQYRHDSLSDTELELLQQQPELRQLYKAVCLMLAGYPKRNPRDPEATLLARLPKLSYPKVSRMRTPCSIS